VYAPSVLRPGCSTAILLLMVDVSSYADASGLVATRDAQRKSVPGDFEVPVEHFETKNGLVVLLSPDPKVASVVVDLTFRAGTLYEPPERAGLAHLAEHLMMNGSTPDTDYIAILEHRGARLVNAYTTPDHMAFRSVMPREELPLALWAAADRLLMLPEAMSERDLDREKRVVSAERAEDFLDLPYAPAESAIHRNLYPGQHPMRGSVLGLPNELDKVTLADVRAFVDRHLVPANGILTITGGFDSAVARRLVEETLGRLASGRRVDPPRFLQGAAKPAMIKINEPISRRPRVTIAWRKPREELNEDALDALEFGALLLTVYTSGAFGAEVDAYVVQGAGEVVFRLDTTLPYEKPLRAAQEEAEVYLRYLTKAPFPPDVLSSTLVLLDRNLLFALDAPEARATLLTHLELSGRDPRRVSYYASRLWSADARALQEIVRGILSAPSLIAHAVPIRPRQPKAPRGRSDRDENWESDE
jgi:predicted Zn-dependent peptidase